MNLNLTLLCFTDTSGVAFHHDFGLVALSYLIATAGSYAALEMIERWRSARPSNAFRWQLGCAGALGGTIWSMHFIAMLALKIDLPLTYSAGMTFLSLLVAISAVGLGLQVIRANASLVRICQAGITVGLGVAIMHYVGMAGLRFPGNLAYTPSLWALSLLVAIVAATVALWLSLTLQQKWQRAVAAWIMGGAICGMHYIGMASTVFRVDPHAHTTPGLANGPLVAAVALTTLALIFSALLFVAADRRLLAAAKHDAEVLRKSNAELTQANIQLELGRQQFNAVLDNMTQGVCLFDGAQRLLVCNRRYGDIYNLPPAAIRPGRSLRQILDDRYLAGSMPAISSTDYLAWRAQLSAADRPVSTVASLLNGRIIAIVFQPMSGGGWVATHEDITRRQQTEADLLFMARHDALTRLPNRVLFQERLEQAMVLTACGSKCAVLCIDLDHFKLVNDTLGHPIGDGLLQAVADRLQSCVREIDTVARLGGDEFAIIQLAVEQADEVELANRIISAFTYSFTVDGRQITAGISVGAAMAPVDGVSPDKLLKNADIALYLAKTEGRGTVRFFEPEMDARIQLRRTMELDLRGAILRNEFEVYYQPLVNLIANEITAFEALLRWHHPVRGLVSPAEFIPLAEETGIIVAIGEWVIRTACCEAENWPAEIGVAVNLSPVQFTRGNLVATVKAALAASSLRPDRLELEITETLMLQNTAATLEALHQLRALGISVALDDFGTGYSSLGYLRSFPFDKIKIDQCFVRDLVNNKEAMSIIRAVTGLGHSLSMKTTAEGVETHEQLETLRAEGCTEVQGYLFSRPRPASELPALINRLHQGSVSTSRCGSA